MESTRIGLKPVLIALTAVAAMEAGGRWLQAEPLLATGLIRLIDIIIISGLAFWFQKNLGGIGLCGKTAVAGLRTGVFWSAVFGCLVLAAAVSLSIGGIPVLPLFRASLPASQQQLILLFIVGGVIGPVAEELVYRGLIYTFLRQWGIIIAVSGSTLLFVLSHLPGSAIPVPQLVGGIVFCLAYERSKSLIAPIIIHMLGNTALFSLALAHQLLMFA